jgi:hypothetical protein
VSVDHRIESIFQTHALQIFFELVVIVGQEAYAKLRWQSFKEFHHFGIDSTFELEELFGNWTNRFSVVDDEPAFGFVSPLTPRKFSSRKRVVEVSGECCREYSSTFYASFSFKGPKVRLVPLPNNPIEVKENRVNHSVVVEVALNRSSNNAATAAIREATKIPILARSVIG